MVYRTVVLAAGVGVCAAGSVELSTNDLGSSNRALDNIKAKWSQGLKVLGGDATLTATYDRSSTKDFVDEATLTGTRGKINYEMSTKFEGSTGLKLSTKTSDGTTIEADGEMADLVSVPKINKWTATRSVSVRDNDCDLEMQYAPASGKSKLSLSSIIGSGFKGTASMESGSAGVNYEVNYDTTLTEGRTLSASVNPKDGSGEIEYVDSASVDGTLTASMPLGGSPSLTLKRSFGF